MQKCNWERFAMAFLLMGFFSILIGAWRKGEVEEPWKMVGSDSERKVKYVVVIDPGHGGADPGKVNGEGMLEKDINLAIAKRVKTYLELQDTVVYMTRQGEVPEELTENWNKNADMRKRIEIIEEKQPDITVSIHQNSFPQSNVHGAQVFYYQGSSESENAAALMQKKLADLVDSGNKREKKPDTSYYLLKKSVSPALIVECGFLTNVEECKKLSSEAYQDRMAYGIAMGITEYLRQKGEV